MPNGEFIEEKNVICIVFEAKCDTLMLVQISSFTRSSKFYPLNYFAYYY